MSERGRNKHVYETKHKRPKLGEKTRQRRGYPLFKEDQAFHDLIIYEKAQRKSVGLRLTAEYLFRIGIR